MTVAARIRPLALVLVLAAAPRALAQQGSHEHDHGDPATSDVRKLGTVSFHSSGAPAAQPAFLRGLALLHNFHYPHARAAFIEAEKADPGFAMAYWGEAMTYNHGVWREQDSTAGRAVLARLGATPDERLAKAPTEREKDYLRSLDVLYGPGAKLTRDSAYAVAMERLAARYPSDPDAQLFYALSLLSLPRDLPTYMRAGAIAQKVLREHPKHPGALHYVIHAYDDPAHAHMGLDAARAYGRVAPDASHALHMTSHIFIAMGMWDDVAAANEAAIQAGEQVAREGTPLGACGHQGLWLQYAYLQQGRIRDARRMLESCRVNAAEVPLSALGFAEMRLRYLIDVDSSKDVPGEAVDVAGNAFAQFMQDYGTAYDALRRGDTTTATRLIEGLPAIREAWKQARSDALSISIGENMSVSEQQLRAQILLSAGRTDEALAALHAAAAREDSLPFEFGPPTIQKPSHELLGEVLLGLGRPQDAIPELQKALARTPMRPRVLAALARASEQTGDTARAAELREQLRHVHHRADPEVSER